MRNVERWIPMYFVPSSRSRSASVPYALHSCSCESARIGNCNPRSAANDLCDSTESRLTPTICAPADRNSEKASRNCDASSVQPLVKSFG